MMLSVTQWFWKHEFWLPPGLTWEDMKETDEIRYPQPQHLLLGIPFAFLLIGLRLAFESWRTSFYITSFTTGLAVLHDLSTETPSQPSKIFNYLKRCWICDTLFIIFSIVFLITCLVIYPYKVLYNTAYYSMEHHQPFFGYYFTNALLIVLQLLNVFWSYLTIRMVSKFFASGTVEKDLRSNSDDSKKGEEDGTGEGSKEEWARPAQPEQRRRLHQQRD